MTLKHGRHVKHLPSAFTEHGAILAANLLNSPQAVQMSGFVVRAFIAMRAALTDTRELARKLATRESELTARLDPPPRPPSSLGCSASWPCWSRRHPRPKLPRRQWGFTRPANALENRRTDASR